MIKLFSILLAYLTAMVTGVEYVPPDSKPYMDDGYYRLEDNAYPDDRLLYKSTIANLNGSDQKCDMSPMQVDANSGRQIVETSKGSVYFPFALKKDQKPEDVIKTGTKITMSGDTYLLFSVPKGTEIIAPYNCTMDNASTVPKSIYPTADPVRGVAITVETEANTDGDTYKITYATLNRLWCNMRKKKPDDLFNEDEKKPIYNLDEPFTGKTTFNQKDVLGEAGTTGLPSAAYGDEAYIAIRVQKSTQGSNYMESSIEDLCISKDK